MIKKEWPQPGDLVRSKTRPGFVFTVKHISRDRSLIGEADYARGPNADGVECTCELDDLEPVPK